MEGAIDDALKPLTFLIGKWKSIFAEGTYPPRVEPFTYSEQLEFTSYGQPMLYYKSTSWKTKTKTPMHLETGFLQIKPGTTEIAFIVAHNFGHTSIEEGSVEDGKIVLKSDKICRADFNEDPAVTEIIRKISMKYDGKLEMVLSMTTTATIEMTKHLIVVYEKVNG